MFTREWTTLFKLRKSKRAEPRWSGFVRFPGVGDHGMCDIANVRQPRRPLDCFPIGERLPTTERREEGVISRGESDHFIVPVKAGNAAEERR